MEAITLLSVITILLVGIFSILAFVIGPAVCNIESFLGMGPVNRKLSSGNFIEDPYVRAFEGDPVDMNKRTETVRN